jgi:hypothetical protein
MTTPTYDLNPDEVQVGTPNGPGLYLAPEGTAAPADTSSPWPSPWEILGYLSDAGPVIGSTTNTTSLTPWQSVAPLRTVITGRELTMQFVLWQLNALTLALYFDADVPTAAADGSLKMEVRTDTPQHLYAVGIDSEDTERVLRVAFHRASLSTAANIAITRGAVVPLDVTLSALDDTGVLADVLLGPSTAGGLLTAERKVPGRDQQLVGAGSSGKA